ncbi:MAG: 3-phosphoshikimate 1-carboxyvinyltransferase [Phycisphaerales bacterium]|nr:3-phosphoshikimate 1-carboxyvinyltransferase [Phycisphaerales bacterium]
MNDTRPISPVTSPFQAEVTTPGSKSLTNRALMLAAMCDGKSLLRRPLLEAEDARRMRRALEQLGVKSEYFAATDSLVVTGRGGRFKGNVELNLNNAGTATRFLAAAACFADGPVVIDGNQRMRERPIGELIRLLRAYEVRIDELQAEGFVPLRIHPAAGGRPTGGSLVVPTTLSSQYISALLLIAPWTEQGVALRLEGDITSPSYIDMTLRLLRTIGVTSVESEEDLRTMYVGPPEPYPFEYDVEPDASGATYFQAAAAVIPGARCTTRGITFNALQHDARFPMLLRQMGADVTYDDAGVTVAGPQRLQAIDADLSLMPDTAMTLAAVAAFADGVTTIRGLRTLRVKETDRIEALRVELEKIGVGVEVFADGDDEAIRVTPPDAGPGDTPVTFDTYDDHRMAMSLALIGLRRPGVHIADPTCVNKTYPGFWDDFVTATCG